jgi:phosphopantetheinyl transferase (holo-ACP synthase)
VDAPVKPGHDVLRGLRMQNRGDAVANARRTKSFFASFFSQKEALTSALMVSK